MKRAAQIFMGLTCLILSSSAMGQVLSMEQFLEMVLTNHPVAQQALLLEPQAERVLQQAKGGFDPKLYSTYDQKNFNGTNYYQRFEGGIKIPTWYGIYAKSGYEQAAGVYLNPEETLPGAGLWFAGVTVPLGKGLVIDQRRMALKQANIFRESNEQERRILLMNLVQDAKLTYLDWAQATALKELADAATILAQTRMAGVKQRIEQGDAPSIDSTDARAQIINFKVLQTQAEMAFRKQLLEVSNFLWTKDLVPLEVSNAMKPSTVFDIVAADPYTADSVVRLVKGLSTAHPAILLYQYKLEQLALEHKNKVEQLKPQFDVNYNFLNETIGDVGSYSINNYKVGVAFEMPVFIRKERAAVKLNEIKQMDTEYAAQQKLLELQNKLRQHATTKEFLAIQRVQMTGMVAAYTTLVKGEQARFDAGESNVFTVNLRANKLLDAQMKQIDIEMKYYRELVHLEWVAGLL